MATARQQAVALLDQYAPGEWSAQRSGGIFTVEAWSKPGTVFVATGAHTMVATDGFGGGSAAGVWAEALSMLREGVEPCDVTDCEGCEQE